ncbi:MAG: polyprenyl synthetase family protein [Planctomycetota bacterium]
MELLWCLGDELGPAFQIRDDVLDLTAGKGRGGEIGCDIREGKPSILVAHALSRAEHPPADRDRLLAILARERDETTEEETRWAIDLFEAGGLDRLRALRSPSPRRDRSHPPEEAAGALRAGARRVRVDRHLPHRPEGVS